MPSKPNHFCNACRRPHGMQCPKRIAFSSPDGLKRKSRHERGYGHNWVKIRIVALKRDDYLCQVCLPDNILTPATAVDHIVPKSEGGTDDLVNLQSICDPCHATKTSEESQKARGIK